MPPITLPEMPKGKELEEFISAAFQCAGYYVERNIIQRDIEEILELDIIATYYGMPTPKIKLIEVKSGGWGFSDLFKVNGWMNYLNIQEGVFIKSQEKRYADFYIKKAKKLNIDLVSIPKIEEYQQKLSALVDTTVIKDEDFNIWRFSYWVERNMMSRLTHKKKTLPDRKCFSDLMDYYFEINSGIFFTENIIGQISQLFSTFQKFNRISARCGNELIGNKYEDACEIIPPSIFQETFFGCKYNDIQTATFIEHKARITLLKTIIDYTIYEKAGITEKIDSTLKINGLNPGLTLLDLLPGNILKALSEITTHKYYYRYPVFWQWFMYFFGGFILKDYENEEYKHLSEKTGIPVEEIPNAFHAYDILFPVDNGWFRDLSLKSGPNIKVMTMFPIPFMGVGANYRRFIYGNGKYEELKLTGEYTLHELAKWHNLTAEV